MKKIYMYVVSIFAFVICLALTLLNARYNCYMSDVWSSFHEITIFEKDNLLINFAALIIFVVLFTLFSKITGKITLSDKVLNVIHYVLLTIIGVLGVIWVLSAKVTPKEDQLFVQQSLEAFLTGDITPFERGGYIYIYPHQTGFMWFSLVIAKIFGLYNYTALQLVNVVGLVLFYEAFSKLAVTFGFGRKVEIMALITGILFYPVILYTTFVYGNILGLAFALLAIRRAYSIDTGKSVLNIILTAFFMGLAVMCKKNYVIFAIGLMIWLFVKACDNKKKLNWISVVILCAGVTIGIKAPLALTEKITGCELNSGIPSISFVAMGLQEGERAPGWYNEYTKDVAYTCNYDAKAESEMAMESVKSSIKRFTLAPAYAVKFFLNKTTSQWCNPTFQSVWINQFVGDTENQPQWVQNFLSFDNALKHVNYLSVLTFLISFGAFIYLVLCRKDSGFTESLILMIILVGGFVFHMFWEAKSEYVISYFVLLIPYSCAGFNRLAERFGKNKHEQESTDNT